MRELRTYVMTLAAATLGVAISLQPAGAQGLHIGAEAGLNVSDLSIESDGDEAETSTQVGLRVGGVLRYDFSPVLGFQTGASFSQKGAGDVTVDVRYDRGLTDIAEGDRLEIENRSFQATAGYVVSIP